MNTRTLRTVAIAILILLPASLTLAQEAAPAAAPLPEARDVLARFVEAVGGEKAIRKHSSQTVKGQIEIPMMGMTAEMTIQAKAPDKQVTLAVLPGLGTNRSGFNGEVAWVVDPSTGPMVLEDDLRDQSRFQADFYASTYGEDRFPEAKTIERVEFEGHDCFKLVLETKYGMEQTHYFDVDSHLLVAIESIQRSVNGDLKILGLFRDYKEFDGVMMATTAVQRLGPGMEITVSVLDVSFDEVPDSAFELPSEIRALLEEPAAAPAEGS